MSCEEIKKLLDEYITGELEESLQENVKAHIEGCPECKREYEDLKSFKTELKSLSEEIPQGFEEKLRDKIRKEKKTAFWRRNHFGAGMAAAVVLVCIIGLGYGMGHGTIVEDKINSVKNSGAQSDEIIEAEEETGEESTVIEEKNNEENAMITEKSEEENNAEILTENTTIYIEEINTELVTEIYGKKDNANKTETERTSGKSVAETKAEKFITDTKPEKNIAENNSASVAEVESEIAAEITTSKAYAGAGRQSLQEVIPETETENKDVSVNDMGIAPKGVHEKSASDSVAAAGAAPAAALTEEAAECDEVTFTVKAEGFDKVYSLLEEREEITNIEKNDGRIYARVNNLPYGELKAMLSELGAEEKDIEPEENCTVYNVVIEAE